MNKKILTISVFLFAICMLFALTNTSKASDKAAKIGNEEYDTLDSALAAAEDGDVVVLQRDIIIGTQGNQGQPEEEGQGYVFINTGKNVTLDMNGWSIISEYNKKQTFNVEGGSTITIKNSQDTGGFIKHKGNTPVMTIKNGTVTLEKGVTCESSDLTNKYGAIQVKSANNTNKVKLIVDGGIIKGEKYGVTLFGQEPSLEVKSGSISANDFAISGSGDQGTGTKNYTVTISGGKITSETTVAIFQPNTGILTINGGTITGKIGIVARQGTVNITGGAIIATGTDDNVEVGDAGVGSIPSGISVALDNKSDSYPEDAKLNITGGSFKASGNQHTVYAFYGDSDDGSEDDYIDDIDITGGVFSNEFNKKFVKGGKTELSITDKKGNTTYYVGLAADDVVKKIEDGETLTVMQGEMTFENLPDNVTVKIEEGATATVNGYEVTETGVDTSVLNKLKELEELTKNLKEELKNQGLTQEEIAERLKAAEQLIKDQNGTIAELQEQIANLQKQYDALKGKDEQDETPGTGTVDVALIASVVAMMTVAGIVTVKKYSK